MNSDLLLAQIILAIVIVFIKEFIIEKRDFIQVFILVLPLLINHFDIFYFHEVISVYLSVFIINLEQGHLLMEMIIIEVSIPIMMEFILVVIEEKFTHLISL